jgi:hypothetical protein
MAEGENVVTVTGVSGGGSGRVELTVMLESGRNGPH